MKKNEVSLETLKASFNAISSENRSVGIWNIKREIMKRTYPQTLISELDASGFIKEWLWT